LVVWRLDRLGRSLSELIELTNLVRSRHIDLESLPEKLDTGSPRNIEIRESTALKVATAGNVQVFSLFKTAFDGHMSKDRYWDLANARVSILLKLLTSKT
jgi:hypothetical protein